MEISENCVYTIVEGERLKDVVNHAGSEAFSEKKRWVTGLQLFNESRDQGKEMLVLFADAADCT